VAMYDGADKKIADKSSDMDGNVKYNVPGGDKKYSLQVAAADYEPASKQVPRQREGDVEVTVELDPVEKPVEEIVLNPIHFEFDKSNITKEGAHELDKLVDIMQEHEDVKIHVIAHTDHIGSAEYNQKL